MDEDLSEILQDYVAFRSRELKESEYRFAVSSEDIDAQCRINPQAHLPNLNETLRRIEGIDGTEGWSVSALSQIHQGVQIFKGPRFKSENIIVEKSDVPTAEPYYTPSAILQDKSDSVKWLDVSRATVKQIATINAIRVHRGDIVVTRSGSIGRVAYITSRFDSAIVSDDLIRIRIPDEKLRLYVFAFLQSKFAQDQMLRNEYGAVQQHLEPVHLADLLVPIPDDMSAVAEVVTATRKHLLAKEKYEDFGAHAVETIETQISGLC
ncbi:restriction endonuclease subunit S [Aeoliella sp. SH292]|uniref:restriction endonuclease subunit S n=1 Tax=Aeoliella sp. SH292 TaxID=3454464 RepID=UPI003F9BAE25